MATRAISTNVEKALATKLDEMTLNKIVERVVKDAERGEKEAMANLIQLLTVARDSAEW
jgi:hypothetical protein